MMLKHFKVMYVNNEFPDKYNLMFQINLLILILIVENRHQRAAYDKMARSKMLIIFIASRCKKKQLQTCKS